MFLYSSCQSIDINRDMLQSSRRYMTTNVHAGTFDSRGDSRRKRGSGRRSQAQRLTGRPPFNGPSHADANARAAAVFAALEADATRQASQLRAAALSDTARLRSCAAALASAHGSAGRPASGVYGYRVPHDDTALPQ